MATKRNGRNGNLEDALATLTQNQAQFVAHLDEDRQRFTRIERDLDQIKALLLQHDQILKNHEQILKDLPELIRQKIGFKAKLNHPSH